MNVLVTGGAGFIGSHVVDHLLEDGHDVLVADNFFSGRDHWQGTVKSPAIERVDILDRPRLNSVFREHRFDAVFHLAAHHYIPFCEKNPGQAYDLNVTGTWNVLSESGRAGVEFFFFASTADVYAPSPRPHHEEDAIGPFTVYGRTKLIGEIMVRGAADWGWRPNALIGRLFNAVGTRETNPHLVPEIVGQIARGASRLQLGNLYPTRDFVDVRSEARAMVDATFAVRGLETVNIGSGIPQSAGSMVDLICSALDQKVEVVVDPAKVRAAERANLCADTNRLKRLIGRAANSAGYETMAGLLSQAGLAPRAAAR